MRRVAVPFRAKSGRWLRFIREHEKAAVCRNKLPLVFAVLAEGPQKRSAPRKQLLSAPRTHGGIESPLERFGAKLLLNNPLKLAGETRTGLLGEGEAGLPFNVAEQTKFRGDFFSAC